MRWNFEKWEPDVAARLISMSLCDSRPQKNQLRRHVNAKTEKSVARKAKSNGGSASPKTLSKLVGRKRAYLSNAFHLLTHQFRTVAAATVILIRVQLGVPP